MNPVLRVPGSLVNYLAPSPEGWDYRSPAVSIQCLVGVGNPNSASFAPHTNDLLPNPFCCSPINRPLPSICAIGACTWVHRNIYTTNKQIKNNKYM